jgi:CotS family spore coat protein
MGEPHAAVLKNFGLKPGKLKKEKAYFIYELPEGINKIYKTNATAERILFEHSVKEHLFNAGFPWVDRYTLSATGQPFVPSADGNYVMTPLIKGRDIDFENWSEFSQALEAVARFHVDARGVNVFESGENPAGMPLNDFFCKKATELSSIAKRVRRQARLSDFDVLFIKNLPFYAEQMKNAVYCLDTSEYISWRKEALTGNHICHHALKEESMILVRNQLYITHFSDSAFDVQLNDLNDLIQRYKRRAGRHALSIHHVLEVYSRIFPLSRSGMGILYALLQFPWNFMKIINQYYCKKRSWTPNAMANRMTSIVSEKEAYIDYIRALQNEF